MGSKKRPSKKLALRSADRTHPTDAIRQRVVAATVRLPGKGGQGVLVPGGLILTAAHCVKWYATGGMALGDPCVEEVVTKAGKTLLACVCAVEPVADIAVLEAPDDQVFFDDAETFDAFVEETAPVLVSGDDFRLEQGVPVHVLTHRGSWVKGTATRYGMHVDPPNARVFVKTEGDIEGGTSGGPIIDDAGRLVGVVSFASGSEGRTRKGAFPRPHLALPTWILRRITDARKGPA